MPYLKKGIINNVTSTLNDIVGYLVVCGCTSFLLFLWVIILCGFFQTILEQGADPFPCSHTYSGESPASAIETQNMQAEMARLKGSAIAMYGVHCCGMEWAFPYAYTRDFTDSTECVHTNVHADLVRYQNM